MSADFVINEEDLPDEYDQSSVIRITENDLAQFSLPVITVTLKDLLKADRQILRITDDDLPAIVRIDDKDLPKILKVKMADLPSDLNNVTIDCFHGTSWEAAEKIRKEGFRVGNGAAYGAGVYFSVGAMTVAQGYVKSSRPCIIQAKVSWGKVAYLDDSKIPSSIKVGGERATKAALQKGYHSFIQTSKYSKSKPTVGIVLGTISSYIRPPRIEVVELIDPRKIR